MEGWEVQSRLPTRPIPAPPGMPTPRAPLPPPLRALARSSFARCLGKTTRRTITLATGGQHALPAAHHATSGGQAKAFSFPAASPATPSESPPAPAPSTPTTPPPPRSPPAAPCDPSPFSSLPVAGKHHLSSTHSLPTWARPWDAYQNPSLGREARRAAGMGLHQTPLTRFPRARDAHPTPTITPPVRVVAAIAHNEGCRGRQGMGEALPSRCLRPLSSGRPSPSSPHS